VIPTRDDGAISIDFLVGFTIFILAFVWVATMIPGMLIGLKATTIDYDAVAYRTGVILAEDPGQPVTWETASDASKDTDITRFGLAIRKDTPNILSERKIERFFNQTNLTTDPKVGFIYPDDYRPRTIFGDIPYPFNITLRDVQNDKVYAVGDILPEDSGTALGLTEYGYIRRLVKIQPASSNATIDMTDDKNRNYKTVWNKSDPEALNSSENVLVHTFAVQLNVSKLKEREYDPALNPIFTVNAARAHDPAYLIDPTKDLTIINVTHIKSTLNADRQSDGTTISLMNISLKALEPPNNMVTKMSYNSPITDGTLHDNDGNFIYNNGNGYPVVDDVSVILKPDDVYQATGKGNGYPVFINYTFELSRPSAFLNTTNSTPFDYNYDPANVTQPALRDGILEVAVW
jgi:hypothetical protein